MGDTCSPQPQFFLFLKRGKNPQRELCHLLSSAMFGARQGFAGGLCAVEAMKDEVAKFGQDQTLKRLCALRSLSSVLQSRGLFLEIKWVSIKDKTEILVPEAPVQSRKLTTYSTFLYEESRHGENQKFTEDSQLHGRSDSDSFLPCCL